MAFDKIKLNPEELDNVSGGYIYEAGDGWEVIDDYNGEVIAGGLSERDAKALCCELGLEYEEIDWNTLKELRKIKKKIEK